MTERRAVYYGQVELIPGIVFLEASGLNIIIGIFGAIAAAWAFAKAKT